MSSTAGNSLSSLKANTKAALPGLSCLMTGDAHRMRNTSFVAARSSLLGGVALPLLSRSPSVVKQQQGVAAVNIQAASPAEASAPPAPATPAAAPWVQKPIGQVLSEAGNKALGGGIPGMVAMSTQVLTLMWLRTCINYQYRYGTSTSVAMRTLYKEGGVVRFYRGLGPALIQGPLSRFGDTAANAGTLALLDSYEATRGLPLWAKTIASSGSAGLFRIALMPIDTVKTMMQVDGKGAFTALVAKTRAHGPRVLYHGALAASVATFVGHYPWFFTYNALNARLPKADPNVLWQKLGRSALMGFCSSFVSDVVSNGTRVIKTAKQTSKVPVTYYQVTKEIIDKDGVLGLLGRGLKTKILANGLQGIMFTIVWRLGQDYWDHHHTTNKAAATATAGKGADSSSVSLRVAVPGGGGGGSSTAGAAGGN